MGFLERLVADALVRGTGLPVGGLVRRVGVGKLATAGGVVAAGLAAADWWQRRQATGTTASPLQPTHLPPSHQRTTLPPLPTAMPAAPPFAATTLPPLPAPPTATPPTATTKPTRSFDEELSAAQGFAVARTILAAALADGRMAAVERATLERHLGADSGLDDDQLARLRADLVMPATPDELAALAHTPDDAVRLYRFGALVTGADHTRNEIEVTWLANLATALGLPPAACAALEADIAGQQDFPSTTTGENR